MQPCFMRYEYEDDTEKEKGLIAKHGFVANVKAAIEKANNDTQQETRHLRYVWLADFAGQDDPPQYTLIWGQNNGVDQQQLDRVAGSCYSEYRKQIKDKRTTKAQVKAERRKNKPHVKLRSDGTFTKTEPPKKYEGPYLVKNASDYMAMRLAYLEELEKNPPPPVVAGQSDISEAAYWDNQAGFYD